MNRQTPAVLRYLKFFLSVTAGLEGARAETQRLNDDGRGGCRNPRGESSSRLGIAWFPRHGPVKGIAGKMIVVLTRHCQQAGGDE